MGIGKGFLMNMQLNSIMMIWCNSDTFSITICTHYSYFVLRKIAQNLIFRLIIQFLANTQQNDYRYWPQESMISFCFPLRLFLFEIDLQFSCIHRMEWSIWTTYLQTYKLWHILTTTEKTYQNEVISIVGTFHRILYRWSSLFVSQ